VRFVEALPPLSLYIHIPWCIRKCPYCDFNSHEAREPADEAAYLQALARDLEAELPRVWGRRIDSIFIGGGTPSLLSVDSVAQLVSTVRALLPVNADAEITLEANPGTVDYEKFSGFAAAGINRLSIGIQSFDDDKLKALGRIHDRAQALRAVEIAHKASIGNLNLDLMFGLPGQTREQALADVRQAIELEPDHISLYQLTIEPNTLFYHRPPALPDDEAIWEMQQVLQDQLGEAGYAQYEVSAYARPGRQCRHNLNYWQFGDYLGIGAGAHGKISTAEAVVRTSKKRNPADYLQLAGSAECVSTRELSRDDLVIEFMMNALRLTGGFPLALFQERTGLALSKITRALDEAEQRNLIERDTQWLKPTETGLRYLNDLLQLFMP